jgi:transposase InsO family protein
MVSTPEGVDTMPFAEVTRMDERRRFVMRVKESCNLSAACREFGITRRTGRKWVNRARDSGLLGMAEQSRAPRRVANRTPVAVEEALLACRSKHADEWGAKKLVPLLKSETGIEIPLRTADRILKRHGCVRPRVPVSEPVRFERAEANQLLQMDFKGVPKSTAYAPFTVLDDAARFCLRFVPLPDRTTETVFSALWDMFGEYGLPHEILCDNGDCWGAAGYRGPTKLEALLMLLGVRLVHGRACHPQTQGKVERFHGTAQLELGRNLIQPTIEQAQTVYRKFVDRYNWVRPHEALGGAAPGVLYQPSPRKRPDRLPEHDIPEGAVTRMVDHSGRIQFGGKGYNAGKGLAGQRVVVGDDEYGPRIFFAGFPLAYLEEA